MMSMELGWTKQRELSEGPLETQDETATVCWSHTPHAFYNAGDLIRGNITPFKGAIQLPNRFKLVPPPFFGST